MRKNYKGYIIRNKEAIFDSLLHHKVLAQYAAKLERKLIDF